MTPEELRSRAVEIMSAQAEAVAAAAERVDRAGFAGAVELVASCAGKVVVSGAGTSGMIGRKIAATLTSTGTMALHLHPADALHGGLGIVTPDDVAILVSNSGETDEVLALLPYLENRKVPVIAIVGDPGSTLARRAAAVLDAFAARESCPLNLAPTTTTSVALALGDALAMVVMELKEVTPEDFAVNHPSGRLGRRLTLTVADVMSTGAGNRTAVPADAPWFEVVERITEGSLGAVTVEDGDGRLVGIVTDGDLRRAVQRGGAVDLASLRAAEVMTPDPVSVPANMLAFDALTLMEDRPSQIAVLAVVDELDRCVGIVRVHDLVRAGI